jgi:hypothetical protein
MNLGPPLWGDNPGVTRRERALQLGQAMHGAVVVTLEDFRVPVQVHGRIAGAALSDGLPTAGRVFRCRHVRSNGTSAVAVPASPAHDFAEQLLARSPAHRCGSGSSSGALPKIEAFGFRFGSTSTSP